MNINWPEVAGAYVGDFIKWIATGAAFHLGWNLIK